MRAMWSSFLLKLDISFLLVRGVFVGRSRSSSSIRLSERKTAFCGFLGCLLQLGIFGVKRMIGCLEIVKGPLRGLVLTRFHVSMWVLIMKTFCNYLLGNILLSWNPFH